MKKGMLAAATVIFVLLSFLFLGTFISRLRMDYNAEGNYFDESSAVVYHQQAVWVYGILTALMLLITVWAGGAFRAAFRKK